MSSRLSQINTLPSSERKGGSQIADGRNPPSDSRCQYQSRREHQLVHRRLHRHPTARLPTYSGLYAIILPEVDTQTSIRWLRKGVVIVLCRV